MNMTNVLIGVAVTGLAYMLLRLLWKGLTPAKKPAGLKLRDRLYEDEFGSWGNADEDWPVKRKRD